MQNLAEFQIIGRVGAVKTVGTTTHVTIAANYPYYSDNGDREDRVYWNEITIFSEKTQAFVRKYVTKGDLVHARGRIGRNSYERDNGETVYTVDLIANSFGLLASKNKPAEDDYDANDAQDSNENGEYAQPARRARKQRAAA